MQERTATYNYAGAMIVLTMVLGGGTQQGLWTDHFLQICLLPALFIGLTDISSSRFQTASKVLAVGIVVLIGLQFVPVLRDPIVPEILPQSGGISLYTPAPQKGMESAFFVFSILGFTLFLSRFSNYEQERLLPFFFFGLLLNLIVGIVQLSSAQFITNTHFLPYSIRVGGFANENHASSLIYIMIPLIAYYYLARIRRLWIYLSVCSLLVFFLFAVGSRAGMAISCAVAVVSFLWFQTVGFKSSVRILLFGCSLFVMLLVPFYYGFDDATQSELRPEIFATTWKAIQNYWFAGSGLGTFTLIYPAFEGRDEIIQTYINHAHNDYLEIFLETGIAGVAAIIMFFVLIAANFQRSFLAEATALSILALAIHSLVDYPLRTMAIAIVLAYFSAVVLSTRPHPDDARAPRRSPGRSRRTSRARRKRRSAYNTS